MAAPLKPHVIPVCNAPRTQVLWDVASGEPVCGTPTGNSFTLAMRFLSADPDRIVTAGNGSVTVWRCAGHQPS
jgi:hypothetical protein